jgi:uncharacterized OB-fold protein
MKASRSIVTYEGYVATEHRKVARSGEQATTDAVVEFDGGSIVLALRSDYLTRHIGIGAKVTVTIEADDE